MTRDHPELSRRRLLQAAGATVTLGATNAITPAAADEYGDPEYPSEAWFAREQSNWARTREEPLRQLNDPAFQLRWQEQSLINALEHVEQEQTEDGWDRGWNLCQRFASPCTGNPYLYPANHATDSLSGAPDDEDPQLGATGGDATHGRPTPRTVSDALSDAGLDVSAGDVETLREFAAVNALAATDLEAELEDVIGDADLDLLGEDGLDLLDGADLDLLGDDGLTDASRTGTGGLVGAGDSDADDADEDDPAGDLPVGGWSGHPFYDGVGERERVVFYDSGLDQDEGGARLSGRVWVPTDSEPGDDLPGVVITNGSIQAPETLYWWFAMTLVETGYVVMTYDPRGQGRSDNETPDGTQGGNFESSVFVTNQVDAIDLFRSTPADPYLHNTDEVARDDHDAAPVADYNPYWDRLDRDRIGIVGHSLGAAGVTVVQGMEWPEEAKGDENPVDVAVAWDGYGGDGLADRSTTPRVPTMFQAADYFVGEPKTEPPAPDERNGGFEDWRAADVPTFQANVRGGTHFEWSLIPPFPTTSWEGWGNELVDHYSLAWFDYWLKERGEPGFDDAERRLLASDPWHDRLSFYYTSSYDFPSNRNANWQSGSGGNWHSCEDILEGC